MQARKVSGHVGSFGRQAKTVKGHVGSVGMRAGPQDMFATTQPHPAEDKLVVKSVDNICKLNLFSFLPCSDIGLPGLTFLPGIGGCVCEYVNTHAYSNYVNTPASNHSITIVTGLGPKLFVCKSRHFCTVAL